MSGTAEDRSYWKLRQQKAMATIEDVSRQMKNDRSRLRQLEATTAALASQRAYLESHGHVFDAASAEAELVARTEEHAQVAARLADAQRQQEMAAAVLDGVQSEIREG